MVTNCIKANSSFRECWRGEEFHSRSVLVKLLAWELVSDPFG